MSTPDRFDVPDHGLRESPPTKPGAFCQVEKRDETGSKYFLVHTASPRFVVEMEVDRENPTQDHASSASKKRRGVIRRVLVPNSWAGDYHRCAAQLGAAIALFESSESSPTGHPPAQ